MFRPPTFLISHLLHSKNIRVTILLLAAHSTAIFVQLVKLFPVFDYILRFAPMFDLILNQTIQTTRCHTFVIQFNIILPSTLFLIPSVFQITSLRISPRACKLVSHIMFFDFSTKNKKNIFKVYKIMELLACFVLKLLVLFFFRIYIRYGNSE